MDNQINPVIAEFVAQFRENHEAYERLCEHTKTRLKALLARKGIMALVTARVKDPQRLEQKLIKRNAAREVPYGSPEDIFRDIPDLIGARIALYFPSDAARIPELLPPRFVDIAEKSFPEKVENFDALTRSGYTAHKRRIYAGYDDRRFDGYCAAHYRVKYDRQPVQEIPVITIEIQVASVLMHAWSEVEHDLAYKEMMGKVTREEFECLDEINGLVMAGEIALNRLSQLSQQRIMSIQSFDTHYTLASYLSYWQKDQGYGERPLGNVETLFNSYREAGGLTREYLEHDLNRLEKDRWYESEVPLSAQLLERFSSRDNRTIVRKMVSQSVMDLGDTELSEEQLGRFLQRWNALDKRIRQALKQQGYPNLYRNPLNRLVEESGILTDYFGVRYRELRRLRNDIVHGDLAPSQEDYNRIMADLDALQDYLKEHYGV